MAAFLRFILVGGIGFVLDAGLTLLLIRAGVLPWAARVPAIGIAMAWTWWANRRFTYRTGNAATFSEAGRYVLAASLLAVLNYSLFDVLVWFGLLPIAALVCGTACQTVVSFWVYKRFVFGAPA